MTPLADVGVCDWYIYRPKRRSAAPRTGEVGQSGDRQGLFRSPDV